jgi:hypothetical protein
MMRYGWVGGGFWLLIGLLLLIALVVPMGPAPAVRQPSDPGGPA